MADATIPISQGASRLGGLSLICLAMAVVGPFLGLTGSGLLFPTVEPGLVVLGFRLLFLLLALIFGILGRRSRAGLMGLVGSGATLLIVLLMTLFLVMQHSVPVRERAITAPRIDLPPPAR